MKEFLFLIMGALAVVGSAPGDGIDVLEPFKVPDKLMSHKGGGGSGGSKPIKISVKDILKSTAPQSTSAASSTNTNSKAATSTDTNTGTATTSIGSATTTPTDLATNTNTPAGTNADTTTNTKTDADTTTETKNGPGKNGKMTLVVPCLPRDLDLLEQNVLTHLVQQTYLPDTLLVALSETDAATARQLETKWREHVPGVELRVLETPSQQSAGENRNRAGREATTEWVSFMDADDWMHPQRLEVVADVMDETGAAAAVHSFSVGKRDSQSLRPTPIHYNKDRWRGGVERNIDGAVTTVEQLSRRWSHFIEEAQAGRAYFPLEAHGHVTVRRNVLDDIKYTSMERNEDTDFIKKIADKDGKVVFIPLPLSEYTPSGVDGFYLKSINAWSDMQASVFSKYNVTNQ